jgi:hypothetical protein
MPTRPVRVVRQALLDKGAVQDENHHMFHKEVEGVTHLITRISHGAREISDGLAKAMAAQCCLRLKEFWELVECPLSEEDWDMKVKERCSGGRNPFLRSRR